MASYNSRIDLMKFKQAQLLSNIDPKNPQRGYVCIPVDINEITVDTDSQGATRAQCRVNMWPLNNPEAYLARINQTRTQRGDAPQTLNDIHTHTLDLSFSVDFVKSAIRAYGQRFIDKVLAAQTPAYAEQIKNLDPQDENSKLFTAIRRYMQPTLARMYPNRTKTVAPATPAPFAAAQQAQQWTPPAVDPNGAPVDPFYAAANGEGSEYDDMPF